MAFSHGYALLIGINENSVLEWSLPDVSKDVTALARVLRHPQRCAYLEENIHILTGQNATKTNILSGLAWLKEKLDKDPDGNTTALIYYSGHGWQDNSLPQPAYYLIPYDVSRNSLRQSALRADDFASEIAGFAPNRLLVLLDCCHSGGMGVKDMQGKSLVAFTIPPDWFMGGQKGSIIEAGIKDVDTNLLAQGKGRAVLNSSRSSEKSYIRKDGQMSIFTYHLIEALTGYAPHRDEDMEVTVADVLSYVWRTVPVSAQADYQYPQHPDGQLSGNFPVALLLGGNGTPTGKALPDPLENLSSDNTASPSIVFDQHGQIVRGSQTIIAGNVNGPVLSGEFHEKVSVDQRKVDTAGGDYIEGNKTVNSTYVGHDVNTTIHKPSDVNVEVIIKAFAELLEQVDQLADESKKTDAGDALKKLEEEAKKGENANQSRIMHWLNFLAGISPDIFDVAIAAFTNPLNGLSAVFKKIAQHAKEEQDGK